MHKKIAFLLQEHFLHYCERILGDSWQGYDIVYFRYETLQELQRVFLEQKQRCDAFLVSGPLPLAALWEVDTPPYAIKERVGSYLVNTYRILLSLLLKKGACDASRIGIDVLSEEMPLIRILEEDQLPELIEAHDRKLLGMTTEELDCRERMLVADYQRRCREGKLDIVITYYYSVVQGLANEKVECHYSYPSRNSIMQALEQCVKRIQTENLRRNQSAVLRISPKYNLQDRQFAPSHGLELLSLKSAILEYCRLRKIEPVLKDDLTDIELYLTVEQLERITDRLTRFDLPVYLWEKVGFHGFVSMGSGSNLSGARSRAMQAQDYRSRMGQDVCVYMDEEDNIRSLTIRGPEEERKTNISTRDVETAANRCHLSAETVYRVIATMQVEGTDRLTSEELMRQGFSLRVANRVLKALLTGGYAEIVGQRRVGNKGRPQNLFQIKLPN